MKQFNDAMAKSLANNLVAIKEAIEKFGKGGLNAIDACSLKGGDQEKKILSYRDEAERLFKEIADFIEAHTEEMNRACKEIAGFDLKSEMAKAMQEAGSLKVEGKPLGKAVELNL